ncbi:uncharacterized protein LOC129923486 isoform X2 [Biomphalaria glabrata]|uniref:Uncharacterized protein LOC129923486 isoform X2 n=1 Tax=Biomphalaria glabrata TaxID=6526 RepID=A0A9W2Z6U3_BIOGL|nr:uncharacterized protein LOC129923486 isoform X2 [Biomphalaria glabrata]
MPRTIAGVQEVGVPDNILGTEDDREIHAIRSQTDMASHFYSVFNVRLKQQAHQVIGVNLTAATPLPPAPLEIATNNRAHRTNQVITSRFTTQSTYTVATVTVSTPNIGSIDLISNTTSKHGLIKGLVRKSKNFKHQLPGGGPKVSQQAQLHLRVKGTTTEVWSSIQCKRKAKVLSSSEQDKMKRSSVLCPLCQLLASMYLIMFLNNSL